MRNLLAATAMIAAAVFADRAAVAQSQADVNVCYTTKKAEEGIAACSRILAVPRISTKQRAVVLGQRASAYIRKDDYDRAQEDVEAALKLTPGEASLYYLRGMVLAGRDQHDRAIEQFDLALRIDPKLLNALTARGLSYVAKSMYDIAIRDYDVALAMSPKDAWLYNARGLAWSGNKNEERAQRDFDAAVKLDPKNAKMLFNRGSSLRDLGELDRAMSDLDAAIRIDPAFALPYRHRGLIFEAKGDLDKARVNLRRALELDPTLDKTRVDLARLDAQAGATKSVAATGATPQPAVAPVSPGSGAAPPSETSTAALTPVPLPQSPAAAPAVVTIPEKRVALVIGNSAYENVAQLPNPANDARLVADTLRKIGFTTVRSANNLKRDAMVNTLKTFAAEAETADWAVVYYAGHGMEVGGVNWLIPIDAALKTDRDVQFEAVAMDQVLGSVDGVKKLALVVLDACRDNPFAAQMRSTSATRSVGRGLAAIEPRRGTLVAFAAKHGQTAMDGAGANSPFVASLVQRMQTPGLEINKVFRLVRDDVLDATNSRQEPFIYGTLPAQDFFFAGR